MRALPQMLLGMAAAGLVCGPQYPCAVVVGAVAGVAPDVIDRWLRLLRCRPAITVTPDPLAPDSTLIIQGLQAALWQVEAEARPCVLRLNPLPQCPAGFTGYALDYDRRHRLVAALLNGGRQAVLHQPEGPAARLAVIHPLPLRVTDRPKDLLFSGAAPRIECRDLDLVAGAGHAVPAAGMLAALAGLAGGWRIGLATAAVLALHLLLDACSECEWTPTSPFVQTRLRGRRLWRDQGLRANASAALLATALLLARLLA